MGSKKIFAIDGWTIQEKVVSENLHNILGFVVVLDLLIFLNLYDLLFGSYNVWNFFTWYLSMVFTSAQKIVVITRNLMRLKLNRHISSISRKELDARIYSDLSKHSIYTNKILRDKEARTSVQNEIFIAICHGRLDMLLKYIATACQDKTLRKYVCKDTEISTAILKFAEVKLTNASKENCFSSKSYTDERTENELDVLYHLKTYMSRISLSRNTPNSLRTIFILLIKRLKEIYEDDHPEIFSLESKLAAIVTSWKLKHNKLLYNEAQFSEVEKYLSELMCQSEKSSPRIRLRTRDYDTDVKLLSSLMEETAKHPDSPYIIRPQDKESIIALFREQLDIEKSGIVKIENACRVYQGKAMEELIKEWKWASKIKKNFLSYRKKFGAVTVLELIAESELDAFVAKIMEVILCMMCKAEGYLQFPDLQFALSYVIYTFYYHHFLNQQSINYQQPLEDIYVDFIRYFRESAIYQTYTQRQWWSECAKNYGVESDFRVHFSEFLEKPKDDVILHIVSKIFELKLIKLVNNLIGVILNSCSFPHPRRKKKLKSFHIRDLTLSEAVVSSEEETKTKVVKIIVMNAMLRDTIIKHQFKYIFFASHLLPLKVPPRPWSRGYKGFSSPFYTRPKNLLRELEDFPYLQINDELSSSFKSWKQARPVFDALNDLGAIPWIINKPMLKHLMTAFEMAVNASPEQSEFLKRLSIPVNPQTISIPKFPDYFANIKITTQALRDFHRKLRNARRNRNEVNSLWCHLRYRLILAHHFSDDFLYFPHNMDFRGRVYPIAPHLNHMGDDINRCLLKFAKGKPLGESGFQWLKLHIVNITGKLKREPISKRFEYFEENVSNILDSAVNPFEGKMWWVDSDDPWQTLAACLELYEAIQSTDPHSFISHLPIHQDGSCNGLQHYAALGLDLKGAKEVNLVPSDFPQDIYSSVAERIDIMRKQHEEDASDKWHVVAKELRTLLSGAMPRKVIKQTVMTTVYGVTRYGATDQIKRQLRDMGIPHDKVLLLRILFLTFRKFKEWFQLCARAICQLHQPVRWVTPLGLPIVQPYVKEKKVNEYTCFKPSTFKQVNAFPPNFVHSLDSTHMMLTMLSCKARALTFAAIHDCYWTHACDVDEMNQICREKFVELYETPIVEQLSKFFVDTYLTPELRELMPPLLLQHFMKTFKIDGLKFGELDIQLVKDSIYFFS